MSVVAVKVEDDKITTGADSITVRGSTQEKNSSKLMQVNDIAFGGVGYAYETVMLMLFCKAHNPKEATEDAIVEFMSRVSRLH